MKAEAQQLKAWRDSPADMVRDLWGVEPDAWQDAVLSAFPHAPRIAMKACKGPGKTCVLAWLAWNFLLTRPFPKLAATSVSGPNLSDGLWAEMAKWQAKSALLSDQFVWTRTRIFHRDHAEQWWMSARAWSKSADAGEQADTLAGLHADYLLFLIDEAGGVPQSVMVAAEAALATGIETRLVIAGNPTRADGPLYKACTDPGWHVVEVTGDPDDPNRSPRISVDWAREQIRSYGADNPWVLVNVFGRFPPSAIESLLGPDEVRAAMERSLPPGALAGAAKILGVDVAREGLDCSVIFPRQGRAAFKPKVLRNLDSLQGAGQVAAAHAKWGADAIFVDNTGGFGAGWIDQLRALGHMPVGVGFAEKATSDRYANKRAEMWFEMAEWIKSGGCLPRDDDLLSELCAPTYAFKGDRLILEPKDAIKARLGRSPDRADALALTFAHKVLSKRETFRAERRAMAPRKAYDPYASY